MIGPLLWLLGKLLVLLSTAVSYVLWPLTWLRDHIKASGSPLWVDFSATAAIVSLLLFYLSGGLRTGWRALIVSLAIFAGIGIVISVMGLDRGGLPVVDTRLWGGLLVTLVVSVVGIVASMPVGVALALGRRSTIPLIRIFSIAFIEFWRGVPLITVLFFATYMLPLFVPAGFTIDGLMRALIGMAFPAFIFYMAFDAYHTAQRRNSGQPVDEFSGVFENSVRSSTGWWTHRSCRSRAGCPGSTPPAGGLAQRR